MRILILADYLPPAPGGLERHAFDEATELVARGHEVRAMCASDGHSVGLGASGGVPISRIDGWQRVVAPLSSKPERPMLVPRADPGFVAKISAAIDRFQPDIIHAHGQMIYTAAAAAPARTPVVATLHDQGAVCPTRTLLYRGETECEGPSPSRCRSCTLEHFGPSGIILSSMHRRSAQAFNRVDTVIAVSNYVRDRAVEAGVLPADKIVVIPNFYDSVAAVESAGTSRPDWMPPGRVVLSVGASRFKGIGVLGQVWRRQRPMATLVAVGEPDDDARRIAEQAGGAIVLAGNRPHAEVLAALRHSVACAAASIGPEACPTAVLEAQAVGCPVVSTDCGGATDLIIDGATGLLVPARSADEMGSALQRVISDTALSRRLSSAAQGAANRFSRHEVVGQIEQLFERSAALVRP